MRRLRLGLIVCLGTIILIAAGWIWFRRALRFKDVDFAGLGEHLSKPLMERVMVGLEGGSHPNPEPGFEQAFGRANEVGMSASRQERVAATSQEVEGIEPAKRLDPWGLVFCLQELNGLVGVVSYGNRRDFPGCSEVLAGIPLKTTLRPGFLYVSSDKALVVVVPRR